MGLYNTPSPFHHEVDDSHQVIFREPTIRGTASVFDNLSPFDEDCLRAATEWILDIIQIRIIRPRRYILLNDTPRVCIVELGYHFGIWPRERDLLYQIVPYQPKRIFK